MKQALLVVNALLVIAVSYLLYKQFTNSSDSAVIAGRSLKSNDSTSVKTTLIAYINMDSIQNKYELAKKVTSEVEKRRDAINNEADKMQAAYNSKFNGYKERSATMTEEQAIAARDDLESTQRSIMEKRQALDQEFGQWASSKNLSLMKDIQDYLKKFNADGTYSFIFSYEPGFFYYSNPANDITSEVLKGLNQQYSSSSKKE